MTCIVGLINKETKTIYIGGDCSGVYGLLNLKRKDSKVFIRDKFIIGFTSSFRMGQLLAFSNKFEIKKQSKFESDYEYMINKFVPAVIDLFEKHGFIGEDKKGRFEGGTFLVGYKNNLYLIEDDFQVAEYYDNYASVGCGQDYALGSLNTSEKFKHILTEKDRILLALESAEKFSTGVLSPFTILSLSNEEK